MRGKERGTVCMMYVAMGEVGAKRHDVMCTDEWVCEGSPSWP